MLDFCALTKGNRIRHINRPEWGLGQLLENGSSQELHVFFEFKGEARISAVAADKLILSVGGDAQSSLLDNLYLPAAGHSRPMVTIAQAKMRLQELYPGGLHGKKMQECERDYKDVLRNLACTLYERTKLEQLMMSGQYAEVAEQAHRLVKHGGNNIPAPFEKMAFGNGIKGLKRVKEFAQSFCDWVLPELPTQKDFDAFANELKLIECAKWPILTEFRFLLHPQTDVLIKPTNLLNAAEVARFDINYRSELNWLTYSKTMEFYNYIKTQIADLKPKDNIDVQNFVWCIDPDYGGKD